MLYLNHNGLYLYITINKTIPILKINVTFNKQFYFRMKMAMLSEAGRIYEKCRKIRPLSKNQRQRVYASCQIAIDVKRDAGEKKFSPFNTVSRQSRNSYLLRVTQQQNTQTNYEPNFKPVQSRQRRSTIDQASFKRIIGPVNENDYSVSIPSKRDRRCTMAFSQNFRPKPLTARETHKWRKTMEHLDFTKQINPQRNPAHEYLKEMKSTNDSFMIKTLQETTESNFNNFKRFSLRPSIEKAHNFKSDSKHQYLDQVFSREIQPEYDLTNNNEQILRVAMKKPKIQVRFDLFRNLIKTRIDRADPNWLQTLDYTPNIDINDKNPTKDKNVTIDFNKNTNRKMNQVHSKYPIRQSLKPYVPLNKTQ